MLTKFRHIVILMLFLVTHSVIGNAANSDSIANDDSDKWYNSLRKFRDIGEDKEKDLLDSLMTAYGKDYWKWAAFNGKLDLSDKRIQYPKFVKWCVDLYNWGDRTFNTYDTAYVVGTGKRWKLMAKNDNWLDSYSLRLPQSIRVDMASDIAYNMGASLSYMAVSLGFMSNMDNVFAGNPVKHKKWEFQFSCALVAFDAYYSRNTGSTNITRLGDYRNYNLFDADYKFSGLTSESYGVDMYYFFNNRKYSQGAAYTYSKYQKKSAGSVISGIAVSHQNVKVDFNTLPEEIIDEMPSDKRNYHVKYNDFCIMIGYGYNWVFKKNWVFNITAIPCFGLNHSLNDTKEKQKDLVSFNIKAKMSLVYNYKRFFYSLNGKFDGHFYNGNDYKFFNSVGNLALVAGFRF